MALGNGSWRASAFAAAIEVMPSLSRGYSYSEALAPPDARPMAIRFLAIPQADPPATGQPPS